ncbi:MAG TPA: aldo/keto reductase [Chitinophagales bacterium]|nr:aldo/keto reductase [Chitinophagales bacterium]HRK26808.1 aldo/keto reductase [Chitinophagales bacterium]
MQYKLLGKSGLRVSELSLGTMTFGEEWGWGASMQECRLIFDAYANAGGNFIDTANYYTQGSSESILSDLIKTDRDYFVLATKYTLNMNPNNLNSGGNHRKNLVQSVNASLKRLGTDYIDLLWLHAWDFTTPAQEVMRSLDDLIRQGKVLYIGISDAPAWIVAHANTLAELSGLTQFIGLQIQYNLLERTVERDLLPMANHFGMSILAWGPLAAGILTGKYNADTTEDTRLKPDNPRLTEANLAIAQTVVTIAQQIGATPSQVALNWVRQQAPNIIPIIGARKLPQLQDNLNCLNFTLSAQHLTELNTCSQIPLGFPHDFLQSENVRKIIFGNNLNRLNF